MLWVADNSSPDAEDGFHVHKWLARHGYEFSIIQDWPACLNDERAVLIVSGGPRYHTQTPELVDYVRQAIDKDIPMLGICLGFFCMAKVLGAELYMAHDPMSDVPRTMKIYHTGQYPGPNPFMAMVAHRERVLTEKFPPYLETTAVGENVEIVGFRHRARPFHAVAFHPEHEKTEGGTELIKQFLLPV